MFLDLYRRGKSLFGTESHPSHGHDPFLRDSRARLLPLFLSDNSHVHSRGGSPQQNFWCFREKKKLRYPASPIQYMEPRVGMRPCCSVRYIERSAARGQYRGNSNGVAFRILFLRVFKTRTRTEDKDRRVIRPMAFPETLAHSVNTSRDCWSGEILPTSLAAFLHFCMSLSVICMNYTCLADQQLEPLILTIT